MIDIEIFHLWFTRLQEIYNRKLSADTINLYYIVLCEFGLTSDSFAVICNRIIRENYTLPPLVIWRDLAGIKSQKDQIKDEFNSCIEMAKNTSVNDWHWREECYSKMDSDAANAIKKVGGLTAIASASESKLAQLLKQFIEERQNQSIVRRN